MKRIDQLPTDNGYLPDELNLFYKYILSHFNGMRA